MQKDQITINYSNAPTNEDVEFLSQGISSEAYKKKGLGAVEHFGFFAVDDQGNRIGGVNGFMYYGCLYIDQLYVSPSHRGLKLGKRLMDKAEELGYSKGCSFSTVATMDWEAEAFYTKLGYIQEFKREGYDGNSFMIFFKKTL